MRVYHYSNDIATKVTFDQTGIRVECGLIESVSLSNIRKFVRRSVCEDYLSGLFIVFFSEHIGWNGFDHGGGNERCRGTDLNGQQNVHVVGHFVLHIGKSDAQKDVDESRGQEFKAQDVGTFLFGQIKQ